MHEQLSKHLVLIRSESNEDKNFIYDSWLNGLYYGNPFYRYIDRKIYYKVYQAVIDALMDKETVKISVACLKEDPDVILGYSVTEGTRLHWLFVKPGFRKLGIATDLLPIPFESISHFTTPGKAILDKKYPNVIFNPF